MWCRQFIDWLKFETRPSSLPNFGMAYGILLNLPVKGGWVRTGVEGVRVALKAEEEFLGWKVDDAKTEKVEINKEEWLSILWILTFSDISEY